MTEVTARRIAFGVTAAVTARAFLHGQLEHFAERGWEVHLLCGEGGLEDFARLERVHRTHVVAMSREPSYRDPMVLLYLWSRLRGLRPDACVFGTPKMGVLGVVAAKLAGVPRRIYLVHGYRAEGLSGARRVLMRSLDRLACAMSTDVVAVSASLAARLVKDGVVGADRVVVMGSGSANGVALERFRVPNRSEIEASRKNLNLPPDAEVVTFVGRLTHDKGLLDLPHVWASVSGSRPDAWLLVAGAEEPADKRDIAALHELDALPRVRRLGHVENVAETYTASDVLLVLSKREGLGMVALEAAACGVPAVAFDVTGVVDAVVQSKTGLLRGSGDLVGVVADVNRVLDDPELRCRLGEAGSRRVVAEFSNRDVWDKWGQLLERTGNLSALESGSQ